MLVGTVPVEPVTSKVVNAPLANRKPWVPLVSVNHPVTTPTVLMLVGLVVIEPGGSKVVKDGSIAAIDEVANATPRVEIIKPRKSFRKEDLPREERNSRATAGI